MMKDVYTITEAACQLFDLPAIQEFVNEKKAIEEKVNPMGMLINDTQPARETLEALRSVILHSIQTQALPAMIREDSLADYYIKPKDLDEFILNMIDTQNVRSLLVIQQHSEINQTEEEKAFLNGMEEVRKLLNGNHEYQSPELAICLKAWLELSHKAKISGLNCGVVPEVERWLKANNPDIRSEKAVSRISKVVNWNK